MRLFEDNQRVQTISELSSLARPDWSVSNYNVPGFLKIRLYKSIKMVHTFSEMTQSDRPVLTNNGIILKNWAAWMDSSDK